MGTILEFDVAGRLISKTGKTARQVRFTRPFLVLHLPLIRESWLNVTNLGS